ncbi:Hypothetical predicted protein, partial [Scomber scombrus]
AKYHRENYENTIFHRHHQDVINDLTSCLSDLTLFDLTLFRCESNFQMFVCVVNES